MNLSENPVALGRIEAVLRHDDSAQTVPELAKCLLVAIESLTREEPTDCPLCGAPKGSPPAGSCSDVFHVPDCTHPQAEESKLHPAPAGESVLGAQRPDQARGIEEEAHVKRDASPQSSPAGGLVQALEAAASALETFSFKLCRADAEKAAEEARQALAHYKQEGA